MKRGPKQKVRLSDSLIMTAEWKLSLDCGHIVIRRIKRRKPRFHGEGNIDPAPSWVYCELCKEKS